MALAGLLAATAATAGGAGKWKLRDATGRVVAKSTESEPVFVLNGLRSRVHAETGELLPVTENRWLYTAAGCQGGIETFFVPVGTPQGTLLGAGWNVSLGTSPVLVEVVAQRQNTNAPCEPVLPCSGGCGIASENGQWMHAYPLSTDQRWPAESLDATLPLTIEGGLRP